MRRFRVRSRLRDLLQGLLLSAVSLLMGSAGAEWYLRHYAPQAGFVYRLDRRYIYTLAPGTRKLFRHSPANGGGRVLFVVNSAGFRGHELRPNPDLRVVVYGDSFIEGEFAPLEETFTQRLGVHLSEALGRDVEAVNGGVNGYGPDQSLRRFENETPWLRPSAVVVAVFADNDFGDVLRNRIFRLQDGRLVDGGGFVAPALYWQFEDAERRTPFHLLRGIRRLMHARRRAAARAAYPRRLAEYLQTAIDLCRDEYQRVVVQGERGVDDVFRDHYDADVALAPRSPSAVYKKALLEGVLGRWREASTALRVPVLVLVIPSPIDICARFEVKVDPRQYPEYAPSALSSAVETAAARRGLPVVNLFEPFRSAGADGLYFHYDNDHWNAKGQDLAARLAAARMLSEGWLGPRRRLLADPP